MSDKKIEKETSRTSARDEIESVVEAALTKHKTDYDLKIASCVSEIDAVKTKVNTIETMQTKLETELTLLKSEMKDIKAAQIQNHDENKQLHLNTTQMLHQILSIQTSKSKSNSNSTVTRSQLKTIKTSNTNTEASNVTLLNSNAKTCKNIKQKK